MVPETLGWLGCARTAKHEEWMKRYVSVALATIGLAAVLGLSAGQPGWAQESEPQAQSSDNPPRDMHDFMRRAWGRMNAEDRAALFDAHLAALHAGLKLTPDQEKLWPPLEEALRNCAKVIVEHRTAAMRDGPPADPVAGLRTMADRLTSTGDALRKVADAAAPLYATLAEDQKRRLPILLHGLRPSHARWSRPEHPGDAVPGEAPGWGLPE
jgi:zinc resistance-associated protein